MKKIIASFLSICIILSGCSENKTKKTDMGAYNDNTFEVSSVVKPLGFKETEIEINEPVKVENLFISKKNIYLQASECSKVNSLKIAASDISAKSYEILQTQLECSYVHDIYCCKDKIFVCYTGQDNYKLLLSSLNKNTGSVINTVNLEISSNKIELLYDGSNIIVSYLKEKENALGYLSRADIYDENLNISVKDTDICSIAGKPGSAMIFTSDGKDNSTNALCYNMETSDIGFLNFSYDLDRFNYISSDIDMTDGYEPVGLYTLNNGNLLYEFLSSDEDMTYLNVYDHITGAVTDMYELEGTSNYIIPGDNQYLFLNKKDDGIYGYTSSSEKPEKIFGSDDGDICCLYNFSDIAHYDKITDKIITYSYYNEPISSLYYIDGKSYKSIIDYRDSFLEDLYVSADDKIYAVSNINNELSYSLQVNSNDGTLINNLELSCLDNMKLIDFCADISGNTYFVTEESNRFSLIILDSKGKKINENELSKIINPYKIYIDKSGNINIYTNSTDGNIVYTFSDNQISQKYLNNYMKLNYYEACCSFSSDEFIFNDNDGIYSYSFDTNKIQQITDWASNYISCSIDQKAVVNENKIICAGTDYVTKNTAVCILERSDDSDENDKEVIKIAEIGTPNYDIRPEFRIYNNKSNKYKLNIINYKNQQELNNAVGKGEVPDIITYNDDSGFDIYDYISEGYVAEISDLIKKDSDIDLNNYFRNLIKDDDGKIYQVASSAAVLAIYNESGEVPSDWTITELIDYSEKYGKSLIEPVSSEQTCNFIMDNIINNYIYSCTDQKAGTCNIDTQTLSSLFDLAKLYYDTKDQKNNQDTETDYILGFMSIYDFSHGYDYQKMLPYPYGDTQKYNAYLCDRMLIMESSEHKDEAWNIIKTFLLDEYQDKIADQELLGRLPLKKSSFNKMAAQRKNYDRETGQSVLSDEFIRGIEDIISKAVIKAPSKTRIFTITEQSFSRYISSELSAAEAAAEVKKNISRYLMEG